MKIGALRRPRFFSALAKNHDHPNLDKKQQEAARGLQQTWHRTALDLLDPEKFSVPLAVGITSAIHTEGKTTSSLGLVTALAKETDAKVLLIECDLGSESASLSLDLEPKPGLAEYISGEGSIDDAMRYTGLDNLKILVMGGGETPDREWEPWVEPILSQLRRRLPTLVASLKREYSYIFLDLPPVLTNPNTKDLVSSVDGAFLAVRADFTTTDNLTTAVQQLAQRNLLGILLIGAQRQMPGWLSQLLSE